MPKTKVYFVESANDYWVLTSSKGKAIRRFPTQRQAIETGSARLSRGGQLVIKKPDGTIQSVRVYGEGRARPAG